ncbi:sporulation-regulated protein 28 [Monosporozyma servazzii]
MLLNTEQLRLNKSLKKTTNFNLLLLGPKGIGKKTFFTNLCNDEQTLKQEQFAYINYTVHPPKLINDREHIFDKLSFPIVDRNFHSTIKLSGFILNTGDKVDNSQTGDIIKQYIEDKFDELLRYEGKIQRSKFQYEQNDNRIHLCIYFIDGNQGKLNEIDLDILNKITSCVNIMFVIGKSDKFLRNEWVKLQNKIKRQLRSNHLCSFKFGDITLQDIFLNSEGQQASNIFSHMIDDSQPFPIICGNVTEKDPDDESLIRWKRRYTNKEVFIEDYQTSFFIFVKGIILGSHLQDFKDTTDEIIYENYRTQKLLQKAQAQMSDNNNTVNSIIGNSQYNHDSNLGFGFDNNEYSYNSYTIKEKNLIIEAYEKKLKYMQSILKEKEAAIE